MEVTIMLVQYQVTLFDKNGKYRPVSAIVKREQEEIVDKTVSDKDFRKKIQIDGIKKICYSRLWDKKDLERFGYTSMKIRLYDKERIEQENKERYEKIKEEKYATGEWKRPKKAQASKE